MRRVLFFIAIFLFTLSSVMGQMIPINLPADGNWPTVVGDSIMIIGPRQNELTEEQRYFNPVYMIVYPGKEHLQAQIIRAGLCDCDLTKPNRRIGVFSVAPDKQVSFSQGNLQYLPAINLWKFANTQYEYLGNANKYLKPTFRNWVDLFGWSANNTTAPFGVSTSTNAADYAGDFVDWGTNTICGDAPNTWRTLSVDEWGYLFKGRKNATQLYSKGNIDGLRGMIILPDNWVMPEGLHFTAQPTNLTMELDINTYTQAEWRRMEEAGAVFLCPTGRRDGTKIDYLEYYGGYWSSSKISNSNHVCHMYYNYKSKIFMTDYKEGDYSYGTNGRAVRLVHDTIVPRTIPKRIGVFSVAADKQVSFSQGNLQYTQSTDEWRFAREQYEYIGAENIKDGALADRIDMFGWSGNNSTAPFGVSTSTNDADYTGEFVDWGTNTICGEAPGTWRTLSADEWEYLLKKRKNASDLYGVAQVAGVNGMIILPDDWEEANGIVFKSGLHSSQVDDYSVYQSFTDAQWLAMENAGAVFLPALGYRDGTNVEKCNTSGYYWSNTTSDEKSAYRLYFYSYFLAPNDVHSKYRGRSVRLVHDTIVPKVEPEPCLVVKVNDTLSINMMCVEGGTFMMGAMEGDTQFYDNEKPAHEVTLTYNYYIAQTEVTQALWKAVMGNNPSTMIGDDLPVNNVLWEEADAFVKRLSQMTGYTFHLPTEAEWEFAARGGKKSKGYLYAGSDDVDEVAWYADNSGGTTHAVGTKKPNELGIYDMSGNAWEWCSDWLAPYSAEAQVNPIGPATGEYHVYHGGGWNHGQRYARSSHRRTTTQGYVKTALGLRVAIREKIEPEAVDLGLSVKWANFNIGAFDPTHYGDYFAWGETEPKETYSWANYKWCDGTQNTMTKYNATDGKTILEPEDDAAHVHWGDKWRMPTYEEQMELIEKCSWERTNLNGVIGYKVTGPNGNSIFIPIAGAYNSFDNQLNSVGSIGWIYSSTIATEIRAYEIHIEEGIIQQKDCSRCVGLTIRPVYDDRPPKRIGVFSVAADKQVSFSQGNLQYVQSTDTWQFAANQLEYMGHKHFRNGQLADTIEYFGWSGKNSKAPWGISLSTESSDYAGEFLDWGINTIAGSAPNTWRTLSNDEWLYICQARKNADQLLGLGKISSIFGLIILPDDWVAPEGITFTPNDNNPNANVYSLQQWTAMEEAGAIFIPPTGYFNHDIDNMRYVGTYGYARNNTLTANGLQIYTLFKPSEIQYSRSAEGNNGNLYYAFPQRLVHDTIVPKPEPEYVDLGLSVKWATFNVGATSPEDYGDYFAWGETEPKETYSWATYKWGTSSNLTKYNATDGKTILDSEDDAAYVHWGGKWRMPSKEEVDELTQQCNWIWTTHNNVNGYKVTGPNGNSIFLPAAGYKGGGPTYPAGEDGLYWTNTIEKQHYSYLIVLHNDAPPTQAGRQGTRCFGFTIRPVYDDRPPKRIGVFSVAADKQVSFSQGNLQYVQSTDTWQFAANQLEYMGHKHYRNGQLADTIEYFGWSGKNSKAPWGISLSTESSDYAGEFLDWGTNTIAGSAPNTWRTLSNDEWLYICQGRKNADQLLGLGTIGTVTGLIILPDDWQLPAGLSFTPNTDNATKNQYTYNQWAVMENAGAVFIATSGYFNPKLGGMRHVGGEGHIRTNALSDNGLQVYSVIKTNKIIYSYSGTQEQNLQYAFAQRLVHDTIVSQTIPDPCLVVKVNDTLSINLMCVEGGTFMMGAMEGDTQAKENEKPAHEVTLTYDYLIMQTEVTQGLWEAVMGEDIYDLISKSSSPTAKPISTRGDFPVGYVQLSQCLEFIDRLNELTGMHFRMPTEAEWEYAARGGNQSKGYLYAGSNTLTQVAQTSLGTVAKLRPNELGIYDMSGNIAEMTLDYLPNHDIGYPSANAQVNPRQISPTGNRAIRGLRWNTTEINCRISHRNAYTTTYSGNGMGFRLVLSKEQDFRTIHFNGSYFDMSFVKGGTFMMGSDAPGAEADEKPVHEVTLSDYYIGQTEVTQHLWKKVMGDENNPSTTKGNNLPVTNITWDEAQVFVERLSELTGMRFRLPTEAEWEYAARGGQRSQGYTYAGSNDIDQVGWYNGNSSNKTHAVGQKQPNELGIYDMTGNVWEYCSDWHMPYAAQAQTNPTGAATGDKHVLRGGCYHYDSKNCTSTNRHSYYTPDKGGASTGLRIVLEP